MSQNENLLNSDKTQMLTEIIHNIVYHYQNNHSRVFQSGPKKGTKDMLTRRRGLSETH